MNGRKGEPDRRGSALDRRRRKQWLLDTYGNGKRVRCVHGCGTWLTFDTVQQDRIVPGGGYNRANIQPACWDCNTMRGDDPTWTYRSEYGTG